MKQCDKCGSAICPVCHRADCLHPDTCKLQARVEELEREIAELKARQQDEVPCITFGPVLVDDLRGNYLFGDSAKMTPLPNTGVWTNNGANCAAGAYTTVNQWTICNDN